MGVLDQLAGALGRNDEQPNIALAERLVAQRDRAAIAILVDALQGTGKAVANDAIKVLYEIGYRAPELIAPHASAFLSRLGMNANRQTCGTLKALQTLAPLEPDLLAGHLDTILAAADAGSVIAKDAAMEILAALARTGHYEKAAPIMLDRIETAPVNQLPAYAELAATIATGQDRPRLLAILENRVAAISQPAKQKRIAKIIRTLSR
ncbi:hypothetical protein [Pelagibacterium halotolerans]|uniref:HEAT repeat domain-containing protein n=1 Tax=Pelagibacterium halotolerans (strain DSM 22347 / JCM 15775 / CGMCC 1.7692 / B2) TaxID=1082931 RepID=G4RFJ3_PELHB|nr:hypothetical protein [Pelagibacterium halotolerans]AEQ52995.1 hypothetical protein KKY_3001 [Pelagibacterium halotolerans B2]QJR17347.1 hypothetical protein HKM20_02060 [Pelagibacterium halotolerans]